jgi:hypothetical protein
LAVLTIIIKCQNRWVTTFGFPEFFPEMWGAMTYTSSVFMGTRPNTLRFPLQSGEFESENFPSQGNLLERWAKEKTEMAKRARGRPRKNEN